MSRQCESSSTVPSRPTSVQSLGHRPYSRASSHSIHDGPEDALDRIAGRLSEIEQTVTRETQASLSPQDRSASQITVEADSRPLRAAASSHKLSRPHELSQPSRVSFTPSLTPSVEGSGAATLSHLRRSVTMSSASISRPESPYRGATGPSHPYTMYMQGAGLSRSPSVATTATARGPTRPDAVSNHGRRESLSGSRDLQQNELAPENQSAESRAREASQDSAHARQAGMTASGPRDPFIDSTDSAGESYPAGARPAPRSFQRHLGPDGEEIGGLVGPDGYTEQLPPYSRYANDIPPKRDPDASSFVSQAQSHRRSRAQASAAVNPDADGSATENGVSADVRAPGTPHHLRTVSSQIEPDSSHEAVQNPFRDSAGVPEATQSTLNARVEEKEDEKSSNFSQRTSVKLKRRVCWDTMPCWLMTAIILIVCLAAVFGGIIGAVLVHYHNQRSTAQVPQPQSDGHNKSSASSSATPSSSTAAQTPDDALPAATPITIPTIPTGSFAVTLNDPFITSNSCLSDAAQNNAWDCPTGAHLSIIVNSPSSHANQAPNLALMYPPAPGSHIRYGSQPPQLAGYTDLLLMQDKVALSKGLAYAFQQPFNKTVIVKEHDFPGQSMQKSKRDFPNQSPPSFERRQQSDWTQDEFAHPGDMPWYCFWNNTVLEGFIYVYQDTTSSSSNRTSSDPTSVSSPSPSSSSFSSSTDHESGPYHGAMNRFESRNEHDNNAKRQAPPGLPEYPKQMKIEERRKGISPVASYCQQFLILDDLSLGIINNRDGSPNIVNLTEHESFNPWRTPSFPVGLSQHNATIETSNGTNAAAAAIAQQGPLCMCAWTNTDQ